MSFNSDFDRAFIERSLIIVETYTGPYDSTILLNCLLGLLIVPKERSIKSIPLLLIKDLCEWGVSVSSIQDFGAFRSDNDNPHNLRGLVWHLRNAVAHFRFSPIPPSGEVKEFLFYDKSGFKAQIGVEDLRKFVRRLADVLHEQ